MIHYRHMKNQDFGKTCRRCINARWGTHLKMEDCLYLPFAAPCSRCEQIRNIVAGLRFSGRWKLWSVPGQKEPQDTEP